MSPDPIVFDSRPNKIKPKNLLFPIKMKNAVAYCN